MGDDSSVTADYMDAAIPITRGGQPYIVYILDSRETARSLNAKMFSLIMEALVLGLIISVLLSFLLAKTMVNPLQRLTNGIEGAARGDFSRKLEVTSGDEIGQLTESFNTMAQRLEAIHEEAYTQLGIHRSVEPVMTLCFMSLAVIPELKLTDMGLFDVTKFQFIPVEAEE